jgi:hypothetical protein
LSALRSTLLWIRVGALEPRREGLPDAKGVLPARPHRMRASQMSASSCSLKGSRLSRIVPEKSCASAVRQHKVIGQQTRNAK